MATRQVLAELADAYLQRSGVVVAFESVGGVDAAKRVQAGEPFDVVVLAADAIDKLVAAGRVVAGSKVDLVRSAVAVAVRAGAPRPDIGTEDGAAARRAGRAQHRLFHRPERRGADAAVRALGHRRQRRASASCRRRPACRWARWWPVARSSSASSS